MSEVLPTELTVTEAAKLMGIPRRRLERRIEKGLLPVVQPDGPGGRRYVTLHTLKTQYPGAWESMQARADLAASPVDLLDDD